MNKKTNKKILVVFVCALVVLIALIYFGLTWSEKMGRLATNKLKVLYGVELKYDSFKLNIFSQFPDISLKALKISLTARDSTNHTDTLLTGQELFLVFHTSKLIIDREIQISKLVLEKPHIYYKIDAVGKSNFDMFLDKDTSQYTDTSSTKLAFELESFTIRNGTLHYNDAKQHYIALLNGIKLTGSLASSADSIRVETDLQLPLIDISYKNNTYLKNSKLTFSGKYTQSKDAKVARFSDLKLKFENSDFAGVCRLQKGTGDSIFITAHLDAQKVDISDFNMPLHHLITAAGIHFYTGEAKLDLRCHGWYSTNSGVFPDTKLRTTLSNLSLKSTSYPHQIDQINGNLIIQNSNHQPKTWSCKLENFSFMQGSSLAKGNAYLTIGESIYLKSKWNFKINLADFNSLINTDTLQVNGKVSGTLSCRGKLDLAKAIYPTFSAHIQISSGQVKHLALRDSICQLQTNIRCANNTSSLFNTTLTADSLVCKLGKDKILGSFIYITSKKPYINCRLETKMALKEIQHLASIAGLDMQGVADMRLKAEGTLDVEKNLVPPYSFVVKIKDAEVINTDNHTKLKDLQLHADVLNLSGKIEDTKLSVYNLKFKNEENTFSAFGIVHNLQSPTIDFKVKGGIDLDYVNKLSGGTLADFKGVIWADLLLKLKWQDVLDEKYDKVTASGTLKSKFVKYAPKKSDYWYQIDDMQVRLQSDKIQIENAEGVQSDGKFKIRGNIANYWHYVVGGTKPKADIMLTLDDFSIKRYIPKENNTSKKQPFDFTPLNMQEVNVQIFAQKLKYDTLTFSKFIGTLVIKPEKLARLDVKFDAFSGQFFLTSTLYFSEPKNPLLNVKVDARNMDIYKVMLGINYVNNEKEAPSFFGRINMKYKVNVPLDKYLEFNPTSVTGEGSFALSDLRMKGHKVMKRMSKLTNRKQFDNGELENIEIFTNVNDGRLYFQPFTLKLSGFTSDIEGYYQYTTGDMYYQLKVIFPPFDLVKIPIIVSGNKQDPKVSYGSGDEKLKKYIDSLVVKSNTY